VQQLHALVNHRAVHCIRLAVKISMNFTRIDFNVPFLASYRHSVDSGITAFCCVHTYRRCRAGSISRHGQTCSRLGARQLSGTYVHSDLPQFSDIRGLISGSMPRYPHTLRPVAFVTVFVCSRLYVFRFRILCSGSVYSYIFIYFIHVRILNFLCCYLLLFANSSLTLYCEPLISLPSLL
jgi:hypothetical protein